MTFPNPLILLLPAVCFLSGCELYVSDDGEVSSVYIRVAEGGTGDLHTLYGSIEIVDEAGFGISGSRVQVEVVGDGRVQDSFAVVTGPEGLVRFEISVIDVFRPYEDMFFRVRNPDFPGLEDRIPIDLTSQIPDGAGGSIFLYEADAVVVLPFI